MKTYLVLPLVISVAAAAAGSAAAAATGKTAVQGTQGFRDEIHRPPEAWKGKPRTGEQVYEYRCKACHAKSTQGAPLPDDDLEWGRRAKQGVEVLVQHAIHGYKQLLMPPRGGCENCSDEEVRRAVMYMLQRSGALKTTRAAPR